MRKTSILIASVLLAFTFTMAAGQQPESSAQKSETPDQTEQPKNEVELKLEEYKKLGQPVMGACVQDCDESEITSKITGHALQLPKPSYPPVARKAHAQGTVEVQIIIDLDGSVMAAAAISGHPLLQATSVAAARQAHFTPSKWDGIPVRVTGVVQYHFISQ